ncbi:Ig-like domain-containing protein [Pseudomonas putida]|uniref:Ig-like domain-containing protein n=1 Tax=Pseudomonas putida TaxID=303 RepID=UPI003816AAB3
MNQDRVKRPRDRARRRIPMALATLAFALSTWPALGMASTWEKIRISGAGASGWQPVVCSHGTGWQSCELPVTITLSAAPPSIPANGSYTTISALVTDYYGVSTGAGTQLNWTTNLGNLSAPTSVTDENGVAQVNLQSVPVIGNATVTATSSEGGIASILIPFTDNWVAIASLYTPWTNSGSPYNCSAWTPDASTVNAGTAFTQSATCNQAQLAYRQDREQSTTTGAIRNVGNPVALSQVINVTVQQTAIGTMQPPKPPEPVNPWSQCRYSQTWDSSEGGSGFYLWSVAANGKTGSITWNTFTITTVFEPGNLTQYTFQGVTYYRGPLRGSTSGSPNYEVCR